MCAHVRVQGWGNCLCACACQQRAARSHSPVPHPPEPLCLAQPNAVDDGGVIELVTDDCILCSQQRLKQARLWWDLDVCVCAGPSRQLLLAAKGQI